MTIHVVGVFDDAQVAASAVQRLRQSGIDADKVETHAASTAESGQRIGHREHHGKFATMFNRDEHGDLGGHLAEATRRGGCVVTVDCHDRSRADEVERILKTEGAVDFNDRVRSWQASGYTGYNADADDTAYGDLNRDDTRLGGMQSGASSRPGMSSSPSRPDQGRF